MRYLSDIPFSIHMVMLIHNKIALLKNWNRKHIQDKTTTTKKKCFVSHRKYYYYRNMKIKIDYHWSYSVRWAKNLRKCSFGFVWEFVVCLVTSISFQIFQMIEIDCRCAFDGIHSLFAIWLLLFICHLFLCNLFLLFGIIKCFGGARYTGAGDFILFYLLSEQHLYRHSFNNQKMHT